MTNESTHIQQPSASYNIGHLTGTTQGEYEAQQQRQQDEKIVQEKTEEEIVVEYVRRQSLLAIRYHNDRRLSRA